MDIAAIWADNKKLITTVAIAVCVALLVIKFFDVIFLGTILIGLVVAGILVWRYLSKKHGGLAGIWKAITED